MPAFSVERRKRSKAQQPPTQHRNLNRSDRLAQRQFGKPTLPLAARFPQLDNKHIPWRLVVTELRKRKQPDDFLFARESGESVRNLRGTWAAMTEEATLPGLLLHDFRRSAVRNMIRRGVPQKTAREISGHKTDLVFNRYNIVSEADLQDAARGSKREPRLS